jgi:hypothetical protein
MVSQNEVNSNTQHPCVRLCCLNMLNIALEHFRRPGNLVVSLLSCVDSILSLLFILLVISVISRLSIMSINYCYLSCAYSLHLYIDCTCRNTQTYYVNCLPSRRHQNINFICIGCDRVTEVTGVRSNDRWVERLYNERFNANSR